jgi:predicted regulator of Ras-like GTPase activity (Roadblock/LC7/MglB family)
MLTSVGEEAVLTVMATANAKLGLIFLEIKRAAEILSSLI